MKKETWEQFTKRVEHMTTDLVEKEYRAWVQNNTEEYNKLQREEELKKKIK